MDYSNSVEASYRPELQREIASLEAKLDQRTADIRREIAELRGDLLVEFHKGIGSVKTELMKWIFLALWVLVALGVIGLYFKG